MKIIESLRRWLRGQQPPQIEELVDVRTGARRGVQVSEQGQTRRYLFPPLMLPIAFRRLFDFDALAREAQQAQQEEQTQRKGSLRSAGLRAILKLDVSRTEELLLTVELSRHCEWLVENPEVRPLDGQVRREGAFCLCLYPSDRIEVYSYSCEDYTTKRPS